MEWLTPEFIITFYHLYLSFLKAFPRKKWAYYKKIDLLDDALQELRLTAWEAVKKGLSLKEARRLLARRLSYLSSKIHPKNEMSRAGFFDF